MPGKILIPCFVLVVTAMLLSPIASRSAQVIDICMSGDAYDLYVLYALDDEGGLWLSTTADYWYHVATWSGAVGIDFDLRSYVTKRGIIVFANGDILRVDPDGTTPSGPLIPGPAGASGVESISVCFGDHESLDLVMIGAGCTVWWYHLESWQGPFEIGSLPSATDPSTWGKIKGEFSD